jgi:transcriptional regulator GlxA family with amidase domain
MTFTGLVFLAVFKIEIIQRIHDAANALLSVTVPLFLMKAIFIGQKKHADKEVLCAQEFIENSPANIFSVEDICAKFGVGRRTFERRFKKCENWYAFRNEKTRFQSGL